MKLGLIAMSGVRVHNAELTALGLTLPAFVERSEVIASLPSLGLLTLAGLTPRDIDVTYLEVTDLPPNGDLPGAFDAVAISSFTAQIKEAYVLADRYRAVGTRVLLGGLHVTALPDEARQHADAVFIGEGEPIWQQALHDLQNDTLQPVYDARGQSFDFAFAPMPRFDLLDISRYNRITVQTQRGCPFRCEFCASSIRLFPGFKVKPIDRVIAEIREIKRMWNRPFIEFADDNTFANKTHGKRLLRAIAKENIRWFTETDISVAEDEELLQLLGDSGCAQILIGLENPSAVSLHGVEQKADWKARQADQYLAAIERIQRRGVTVNGCFVLGLDNTDETSFDSVLDFVRQSGLYEVQITVQTPFPGTPLYTRLREEGRLINDTAWETCTLFDVNFQPTHMTVATLEQKFRGLMSELYTESARRERKSRFRQTVRGVHPENKNTPVA